MPTVELLDEVYSCNSPTQVVHELFDFKIGALPDQLKILLLEIIRVYVHLSLALWYLNFELFTVTIENEAIAFGH